MHPHLVISTSFLRLLYGYTWNNIAIVLLLQLIIIIAQRALTSCYKVKTNVFLQHLASAVQLQDLLSAGQTFYICPYKLGVHRWSKHSGYRPIRLAWKHKRDNFTWECMHLTCISRPLHSISMWLVVGGSISELYRTGSSAPGQVRQ